MPSGRIRVATVEQTVVDLIDLPDEAGNLSNVATILREIGPLDGEALARLARPRGRSLTRRVGWMVEHFGSCASLEPLRVASELDTEEPALLRVGARRRGRTDRRRRIRVNSEVQPDQ